MSAIKIYFSVNNYDRDGDIIEEGVFLHFYTTLFGKMTVKVADSASDFPGIVAQIDHIGEEISENYSCSDSITKLHGGGGEVEGGGETNEINSN